MNKLPLNQSILPPYDDRIFKTLLTHPNAKPALIDLISAFTNQDITDVLIRNNELPTTDTEEKNERFDVNCVITDGSQVNVEIQGTRMEELTQGHTNFINKYIYYLTDLHSSQKSKGIKYSDLVKTYQIVFIMYTIYPNKKDHISRINLRNEQGEIISDQINMLIVELSKIDNILKKPVSEMTPPDMWSVFLGYADDPKYRMLVNDIIERKEVIGMAGQLLTSISTDEHERAKFMSRRKAETDRVSDLLTAEARGLALGRDEGLTIGRNEGRIEEKIAMSHKMKQSALLSIEQISQITGLSITEIEKL